MNLSEVVINKKMHKILENDDKYLYEPIILDINAEEEEIFSLVVTDSKKENKLSIKAKVFKIC